MRLTNPSRPNTILLLLVLCAGMLAPGLAGGQVETPLDVCLDDKREWAAQVDPCRTVLYLGGYPW